MKLTSKVFTLTALALIALASQARAEEQVGFPVQVEIESRQIHTSHSMRNLHCLMPMMVDKSMAPAILFPTGSDKLTAGAAASVHKVAAMLRSPAYRGHHVLVSGYTDSKGKDASNQRLSYHRAVTVMNTLIKEGVPASMLTAQGFGKENPVADNATADGRALNRRVTVTVD